MKLHNSFAKFRDSLCSEAGLKKLCSLVLAACGIAHSVSVLALEEKAPTAKAACNNEARAAMAATAIPKSGGIARTVDTYIGSTLLRIPSEFVLSTNFLYDKIGQSTTLEAYFPDFSGTKNQNANNSKPSNVLIFIHCIPSHAVTRQWETESENTMRSIISPWVRALVRTGRPVRKLEKVKKLNLIQFVIDSKKNPPRNVIFFPADKKLRSPIGAQIAFQCMGERNSLIRSSCVGKFLVPPNLEVTINFPYQQLELWEIAIREAFSLLSRIVKE